LSRGQTITPQVALDSAAILAISFLFGPVIFLAQMHSNLEHNFRISAVTVAVPCNVKDEEDGFEVDVSKLPQ